jgi:polar amino acid transport system permease protein
MALTRRQRQRLGKAVAIVVPVGLAALVAASADWGHVQHAFFQPDVAKKLFPKVVTVAAVNTIKITALSFLGGLALGLVAAIMRLSPIRPYRWLGTLYVEFFRGIPALITLFLIGFALPIALQVHVPGGDLGAQATGLAIVAGAYIAEVIRAGILAVPKGQTEAARSLGMSPTRTMVSVVLPQAFRIVIPPLTNELVLLVKDSSLVFVLGATEQSVELTKYGRDIMSRTFNGTPLTIIALMYLLISLPLTRASAWLEKRGAGSARR